MQSGFFLCVFTFVLERFDFVTKSCMPWLLCCCFVACIACLRSELLCNIKIFRVWRYEWHWNYTHGRQKKRNRTRENLRDSRQLEDVLTPERQDTEFCSLASVSSSSLSSSLVQVEHDGSCFCRPVIEATTSSPWHIRAFCHCNVVFMTNV